MVQEFTTDEGVPLTEDVIKKPPREFSATFAEWAADNVEQIFRSDNMISGNKTIYTVPDNFTLFITGCYSQATCTSGAGQIRSGGLTIRSPAGEFIANLISSYINAALSSSSNSINFSMPIRVLQKEVVVVTASPNTSAVGAFFGFLLPKKISIR